MYRRFSVAHVVRIEKYFIRAFSNGLTARRLWQNSCSLHFANRQLGLPVPVCSYERVTIRYFHDKMPRLQHKREKLRHVRMREKNGEGVPHMIDVQVIGNGGCGNPISVILATTQARYLFNCGEGTQRISAEFRMKLSKLENIFITHKSWNNIGGLMGMCLTLESTAVPQVTIHGPPQVEKVTSMIKGFAESQDFILKKRELEEGYYEDTALKIEYVPFGRSREQSDSDKSEPAAKKMRVDNSDISVGYICTPKAPKRSLLLDKCVEAGVQPGPLFKQLQNGESITLENGNVVHPDDVLKPVQIQKPIIIVECVSADYLPSLLSNSQFKKFTEKSESVGENEKNTADIVVHMTPTDILQLPQYKDWIRSFGESTNHLLINETASDVCHAGLYRLQTMLNLLHPRIFPLLPHQTRPTQVPTVTDDGLHLSHTNLKYQYRPPKGFIKDLGPDLDLEKFKKEATDKENVVELLAELKDKLNKIDITKNEKEFPEVVFLGTGASVPNKDRNVSCILVRLNEETNLLFDCGEGSAGQLYRHFGPETDSILCNLKGVFISHMHLDHHLGIFRIIQCRNEAFRKTGKSKPTLLVTAPGFMGKWIDFFDKNVSPVMRDLRFIPIYKLLPHEVDICDEGLKFVLQHLKLQQFLPIEVDHCRNAFGVRIEVDGVSIVYSGDTMPCSRLIKLGADCDLLIHEATMEDELYEDAKFKTHSTTSQAIDVGIQMRAKFILLNHFSQRYSKIPKFNDRFTDRVGISFDNMRVRICDLQLLPHFMPALQAMFAENVADLELKSLKRTMKKRLLTEVETNSESVEKAAVS